MDKLTVDLNAPAFGPGSQKINEPVVQEQVTPSVEEKPVVEAKVEDADASVEEQKVPYSRFKKFHDRATEAEQKALELEERLAQLEAERERTRQVPVEDEATGLPSYWVELYGDSDASKRAFNLNQQEKEKMREELREEAIRAIREERLQEESKLAENVGFIENGLEELSDLVGRELTEKEQTEVLDIVDQFTPKDKDGNYLGATIPFDKAWEIYELKNQASKAPKIQARNAIANLTGSETQGQVDATVEANKAWNPSWSALQETLRRKMGG